jgi:hypothetical protein
MPKANPIIIDDKCNIQDGIVFHDPIGCLKGLYPAWRYRARSAWRRRRSYRKHGYGHERDPRNGAEQISN